MPNYLTLSKIDLGDSGNAYYPTPVNLGGSEDYEQHFSLAVEVIHSFSYYQAAQRESPMITHWIILCATHKHVNCEI